ncbi:hypothetical protein L1049_016188 [Liquidambar formosana]|uniref:Endonuclease/exonuclease/phosphatase domain-containing protein n=1 Tax=Liquidambar formosana TaxID=63359 RepID=A0AAP0RZ18_LIQFO
MNLLAWNCRGLARPAAIRSLLALVHDTQPDVVFLAETKITDATVKKMLYTLGFLFLVSVPPVNTAGGLCLAWRKRMEIEVTVSDAFFINALVFSSPPSIPWMFTCVYGPPYWQATLKEAIAVIQCAEASVFNLELDTDLQVELDECLKREESLWRQNSRIQWLSDGDRNTKFFHLSFVIRGHRNSIDLLIGDDGQWLSNRSEIGNCFINFFRDLFSSSNPTFPVDLDGLILNCISDDDNLSLCAIPDDTEIRDVLFKMASYKAPGPDGMSVLFYKHY